MIELVGIVGDSTRVRALRSCNVHHFDIELFSAILTAILVAIAGMHECGGCVHVPAVRAGPNGNLIADVRFTLTRH